MIRLDTSVIMNCLYKYIYIMYNSHSDFSTCVIVYIIWLALSYDHKYLVWISGSIYHPYIFL